jgi:phospholipase A1/A2
MEMMGLKTKRSMLAAGLLFFLVPAWPAAGEGLSIAPEEPAASAPATQEKYPDLESLFTLYQPYIANISAYEPLYFLVGRDPEESTFQISLKYRFFNPEGSLSTSYPWMQGFHLGYTQTSYWDLSSNSAPFSDTSYKPEVFFLSSNIGLRPSWMQGFFLQTGFQHESNGRGEDFSRSTNFLYAEPTAIFYNPASRLGLLLRVRGAAYVHNNDRTNPDLAKYRGYYRMEGKFGRADGWVLGSALRLAEEGTSVQVDLTYPIHRIFYENFNFYFHVQYVNTLAESLLDYRQRTRALRLGLAIVR